MGIRIHAGIGWGSKKFSKIYNQFEEKHFEFSLKEMADWCLINNELVYSYTDFCFLKQNNLNGRNLMQNEESYKEYSLFTWHLFNHDCKLSEKQLQIGSFIRLADNGWGMIFNPFDPNWQRYDDIMDHYLFPFKNKFDHIHGGIWPYGNYMFSYKNIEKVKEFDLDAVMEIGEYNQLIGKWDKKQKPWASGEKLNFLIDNYRIDFPLPLLYPLVFMKHKMNAAIDIEEMKNVVRPAKMIWWC